MEYLVRLTAQAEADAFAVYEFIRQDSPENAQRWLIGLFSEVFTLSEMPARCPLIPEEAEIGKPFRQLLYGKRTGTYRLVFDIQDESDEGQRVRVLRVWHGARDRLQAADLVIE